MGKLRVGMPSEVAPNTSVASDRGRSSGPRYQQVENLTMTPPEFMATHHYRHPHAVSNRIWTRTISDSPRSNHVTWEIIHEIQVHTNVQHFTTKAVTSFLCSTSKCWVMFPNETRLELMCKHMNSDTKQDRDGMYN